MQAGCFRVIFATVGTYKGDDLVRKLDEFAAEMSDQIVIQIGKGKYIPKNCVQQVSFSGRYAIERGQEVLYVTERAVMKLSPEGVVLTEIAPGVDLQKDILDMMDFRPLIPEDMKTMDKLIYSDGKIGLKQRFNQ